MNQTSRDSAFEEGPLAIICGGGSLPFAVADAVTRRGRPAVLFALRGFADPARVTGYRHYWMALGQRGWFRRVTEKEACRDVVLIGSVVRPALRQIRLDLGTLLLLPKLVAMLRGGDDYVLSGLIGRIRAPTRTGVLVKAAKPGQDRRVDLPTIGPSTIEAATRAGLAGIAVVAGETIIAEPERVTQAADRAGLFVIGVPGPKPGGA